MSSYFAQEVRSSCSANMHDIASSMHASSWMDGYSIGFVLLQPQGMSPSHLPVPTALHALKYVRSGTVCCPEDCECSRCNCESHLCCVGGASHFGLQILSLPMQVVRNSGSPVLGLICVAGLLQTTASGCLHMLTHKLVQTTCQRIA